MVYRRRLRIRSLPPAACLVNELYTEDDVDRLTFVRLTVGADCEP